MDLLHLHGYGATDFGRVVARVARIPSIVHEHFIDQGAPLPERPADLALRPFTTWAIAVSGAVRDFMVRRRAIPPGRLEVVPNGAALESMAPAPPRGSPGALALRAELGIPAGTPSWPSSGGLIRSRGTPTSSARRSACAPART